MDILGIGPLELVLILIVALAVFGPDKLPGIGARMGRAMRDMRRATRAFSQEIDAARQAIEAPVKEMAEPVKEVAGTARAIAQAANTVRNPSQAIRDSVMRELKGTEEESKLEAEAGAENTIAPPALAAQSPDVTAPEAPSAAEAATHTDTTLPAEVAPDAAPMDETPALPAAETPLLLPAPADATSADATSADADVEPAPPASDSES